MLEIFVLILFLSRYFAKISFVAFLLIVSLEELGVILKFDFYGVAWILNEALALSWRAVVLPRLLSVAAGFKRYDPIST